MKMKDLEKSYIKILIKQLISDKHKLPEKNILSSPYNFKAFFKNIQCLKSACFYDSESVSR